MLRQHGVDIAQQVRLVRGNLYSNSFDSSTCSLDLDDSGILRPTGVMPVGRISCF
jgi:hypothetical protein